MPAVGIDLGTTYSVVAWVNGDGDPEIIPNAAGEPLTPSVVSFAGGRPVVGAEAKADQARGEPDVAAFFKRSMGDPAFVLAFAGRDWTPTDLSALVLSQLRLQAEAALGEPVTQAVITVPEYFTHPQRQATIDAGRAAGLDVLRIISEPTAAALAYGLRPQATDRRVLVYDLGGGTFDVSLVDIGSASIEVVRTAGNHQLGGRDWDDRLADVVRRKLAGGDGFDLFEAFADDPGALLVEIEKLKLALTARRQAPFRITVAGRALQCEVARDEFDESCQDLLEQTGQLTEKVLHDSRLAWPDIDGVLPVGGATRMPMVREWLEARSGRPPMSGAHPDQVVALGAAIQAGLLSSRMLRLPPARRAPRVQDVVAHSLGLIAESGDRSRYVNSVVLRGNLPIPTTERRPYHFALSGDGTDLLEVFLTQGESDDPASCAYLGRYAVTGFPRGRRGEVVVDVTYSYDENAIVGVTATERSSGTPLAVRVEPVPDDVPDRFLREPPRLHVREQATVYLAFDLSGSMAGKRIQEATRAAREFVAQLDLTTTSAGLVGFSDRVQVILRATQNAAELGAAIDRLDVGLTGIGTSADPFDELHHLLRDASGRRFAVVLTDGEWYNKNEAIQRAARCHQDGIDVIAIGTGDAKKKFLDRIASSTQQSFFTDAGGLAETFSTIARELTEGGLGIYGRSR